MTDEQMMAYDIELSREVLQDLIDSYCEGDEHKLASMCIYTLYELASMYQGVTE